MAKVVAETGAVASIVFDVDQVNSAFGYVVDFPVNIQGEMSLHVDDQNNAAIRLSDGATLDGISVMGSSPIGIEIDNGIVIGSVISGFTEGIRFSGPGSISDSTISRENQTGIRIISSATDVVIKDSTIESSTGVLVDTPIGQNYSGEIKQVALIKDVLVSNADKVGILIKRNYVNIENVFFRENEVALEVEVEKSARDAQLDPITTIGSRFVANKNSVRVRRANGFIFGGSRGDSAQCVGDCNQVAGSLGQTFDVADSRFVHVKGNEFGINANGGILANSTGLTFANIEDLEIGESYFQSAPSNDCKNNCNHFGPLKEISLQNPVTEAVLLVKNSDLEFHANLVDPKGMLARHGLLLRNPRNTQISRNRIANVVSAIEFSGTTRQLSSFDNLVEHNVLGKAVQSPNLSIEKGLNFSVTNQNSIGRWDVKNNIIQYVDTGMSFEGKMADSFITSNDITKNVSGNALSIRSPNLTISDNWLTATPDTHAIDVIGQSITDMDEATNVEISKNIIGSNTGPFGVGVALRHGPKDIRIFGNTFQNLKHQIDVRQTDEDLNPNSGTVQHYDNIFSSSVPPIAFRNISSSGSSTPIGFSNDPSDSDIGPNTILNPPWVLGLNTLTNEMNGNLSVAGAVVRVYIDNGITISPAPSGVVCNKDLFPRTFRCYNLETALLSKYLLSAEARVFELPLTLGDMVFAFSVDGTSVSYQSNSNDTLKDIGFGIQEAADSKDITVNHDCLGSSIQCRLWVIVAPGASVSKGTFPSILNQGIATSEILRQGN